MVCATEFWRDLQSAFTTVTRFLATAMMTTFCGFPAARIRFVKGFKTGL